MHMKEGADHDDEKQILINQQITSPSFFYAL